MNLYGLSEDQLLEIVDTSNNRRLVAAIVSALKNPLNTIKPRSDKPHLFDEQASFVTDKFQGLAVAQGGTGSGKSEMGALKTVRFLLETPPPRPNTPFWVFNKTQDMVCRVNWGEKLSKYITPDMRAAVSWYNQGNNWAKSVVLKKHANGNNWLIEFMSMEMDRERLQSASIGGFHIDEQCPFNLIMEIWGRCRDYAFPGSMFYTLTPLKPDEYLEERFNEQDKFPDWRFYRMNSELNIKLASGYLEQYLKNELEELRETRRIGSFASFYGAIYPQFNPKVHVCKPFAIPESWWKIRSIDFGFSHPTACLWLAKDHDGCWYVYDEYYQAQSTVEDHVKVIKAKQHWDTNLPAYGPTYADPANAQAAYEFEIRGLSNLPAEKDVLRGINAVRRAIDCNASGKPGLMIFEHCKQTIKEIRNYQWHPNIKERPLKNLDDCADALRYGIFSDKSSLYKTTWKPLNIQRNGSFEKLYTKH